MQLAFATLEIRQLCESAGTAKRILGEAVAARLRSRLADLRAASNANDLPAGLPADKSAGGRSVMKVNVGDEFILVFCANHNTEPQLEGGGVDWARVTRVQILEIVRSDG